MPSAPGPVPFAAFTRINALIAQRHRGILGTVPPLNFVISRGRHLSASPSTLQLLGTGCGRMEVEAAGLEGPPLK